MNNIYKSNSREITFKANGDKITAKAVVSFQEITGMRSEKITKTKCKWIHQVLNTLSTAFHIHDIDNLLSAFRQFLKSQLAFLKKITFYTLFNLKAVMAYIWKTKAIITKQESSLPDESYHERIEKMIAEYKANQERANITPPPPPKEQKDIFSNQNISVTYRERTEIDEKLLKNKTFSFMSPNIVIQNPNISTPTAPKSLSNLLSSFLDNLKMKKNNDIS